MLGAHIGSMSTVTHVMVLACLIAFITRAVAEAVCTDDFYGVLEGTPHRLPEHFLLPRLVDWAISVPPVCRGEYLAGMEARVCTFVPTPIIRIVDWSAAIVHMKSKQPSYTSVNVTVYCTPQLQQPAPAPASTSTTTSTTTAPTKATVKKASPASSEETSSLDHQLRAKPLSHRKTLSTRRARSPRLSSKEASFDIGAEIDNIY